MQSTLDNSPDSTIPSIQGKLDQVESTSKTQAQVDHGKALFSVLAAALLWSTSYVATKEGMTGIPPLTFGAVRFVFAALLVMVLVMLNKKREKVPKRDIVRLALGGFLGITIYFSLQNLGVQRTSASEASLLVASFPAITMLLEAIFYKKRISLLRFAGVGAAFIGIYLIINQSNSSAGPQRLVGDMYLLATGLAWALYNFVTQNVVKRYSTLTVIFWQTLFGAAAFLPLTLFEPNSWTSIDLNGLLSAVYLGSFCSIGAFLFYSYGLKKIDSGSAVGLLNLIPVFGLGLGVLILKESLSLPQLIGGLIVIGGVLLTSSTAIPKMPPSLFRKKRG